MKALYWIQRKLSRLTPLESAVLCYLASVMVAEEGGILECQWKVALVQRPTARRVNFTYRNDREITVLGSGSELPEVILGRVRVCGQISGFKTTATVKACKGVLVSIDFEPIPWSGNERLDLDCDLGPGFATGGFY